MPWLVEVGLGHGDVTNLESHSLFSVVPACKFCIQGLFVVNHMPDLTTALLLSPFRSPLECAIFMLKPGLFVHACRMELYSKSLISKTHSLSCCSSKVRSPCHFIHMQIMPCHVTFAYTIICHAAAHATSLMPCCSSCHAGPEHGKVLCWHCLAYVWPICGSMAQCHDDWEQHTDVPARWLGWWICPGISNLI